jgi:hypothetical protein
LTQLQERAGSILKTHLTGVSRTAILGPNALELTFPRRYSLAKQYIDGPNGRGRIEQILAELAGRPVRLTCRLADDEPSAPTAAATPAPTRGRPAAKERQRPAEVPEEDDFVLKAVSIFEAKVLKVTELGGPAGE